MLNLFAVKGLSLQKYTTKLMLFCDSYSRFCHFGHQSQSGMHFGGIAQDGCFKSPFQWAAVRGLGLDFEVCGGGVGCFLGG